MKVKLRKNGILIKDFYKDGCHYLEYISYRALLWPAILFISNTLLWIYILYWRCNE